MADPGTLLVSTSLSIVAVAISVYTLWSQHLQPFTPVFLMRKPGLRFVEHTLEAGTVAGAKTIKYKNWQPLVEMKIAILNKGAKPGTIADFRLSFQSDRLSFALFPEYVIDEEKWDSLEKTESPIASSPHDLRKKVEQDMWSGLLLPKAGSDSAHLMFQTNSVGFREIPTGDFRVVLEYVTSSGSPWRQICEYEFTFSGWSRSELAKGAGFIFGVTKTDRVWPQDWKDVDKLLMDEDIESSLGVSEPKHA